MMVCERRTAICPGTFDPMTRGHLDIIERAARLFDRVIVLVAEANSGKQPLFEVDERLELASVAVAHLDNVEVDTFGGLLVDYARRAGAAVIVKGVRSADDLAREQQMAMMNREMLPETDTVLLVTAPRVQFVSSSLVRQIWALGGDVDRFVPAAVAEALRGKRRQ